MSLQQRRHGGLDGGGERSSLSVNLEAPIPHSLPPGCSTAVFLFGTCFDREREIDRLEVTVDGRRLPVNASGMPRPDLAAETSQPGRFRSGFWATVPVRTPPEPGRLGLGLRVEFVGDGSVEIELAEIEVVPPAEAVAPSPGAPPVAGDAVAICMATYNPPIDLFEIQIESIRNQTHRGWICLISDDRSDPDSFRQITEVVGTDPRFVVSRSETRIGFYRNFERALRMVPTGVAAVALADQDDRWHPDKLTALREALGNAALVHSDLRMVDREGKVLAETLWKGRRNNLTNFGSMLISNTIAGVAMMFPRSLLETALPFPEGPGWQFHDHWLSTVAMATGRLAYVDRPLFDHVQHAGAITGQVAVEESPSPQPGRAFPSPGALRGLLGRWRAVYFRTYVQLQLHAETVLARIPEDRLGRNRRRSLRLLARADRSATGLIWLIVRCLRPLYGRNETLGTEQLLITGLLWRRLIGPRSRLARPPHGRLPSAELPPLEVDRQGTRRVRRWRANL